MTEPRWSPRIPNESVVVRLLHEELDSIADVFDIDDLARRVIAAIDTVEHGYTEGDVNHNLQPLVGHLRLMLRDGKTPDAEWMEYAVDRMRKAYQAENAWLHQEGT
jgi:hypothetical protein